MADFFMESAIFGGSWKELIVKKNEPNGSLFFNISKALSERFFSLPLRAGSSSSVNKTSIPKRYGESVNERLKIGEC